MEIFNAINHLQTIMRGDQTVGLDQGLNSCISATEVCLKTIQV